ncbi:hypothetical protein PGTUg99_013173 [Puccinia graminis f. sp. tritici]|uniref:Uncharacterized protein n=1 Tax=Puccinia graminis f. sp. tritici TaxID=56615 RepID=A0A5B0QL54_PUCGR|nr:hypothetical protein PGTUg99_013173 [Puccinia graminis f. sp. tritici]
MDPIELMDWIEEDDDLLASLQTTVFLLIKRKTQEIKQGGSFKLRVLVSGELWKLPKLAAYGGFDQPPQTLAAHSAGPLEAKEAFQAAKVGPRSRNSGSVRDALRMARPEMTRLKVQLDLTKRQDPPELSLSQVTKPAGSPHKPANSLEALLYIGPRAARFVNGFGLGWSGWSPPDYHP